MISVGSYSREKDSLQQLVDFSALAIPAYCLVCFYFSAMVLCDAR